jgi:pyrimidine operon attenuation protein/uracil phosphoribosyltransferase
MQLLINICIFDFKMNSNIQILDSKVIDAKLQRMALEIIENNIEEQEIVLAGIMQRGADIAKVLKQKIEATQLLKVIYFDIIIDKSNPTNCSLDTTINLDKKSIIVVDDVANSGRTLLYALNPFLNVIAKKIQVAVLVDRKHKNYPVSPDYVGTSIATTLKEHISVEVKNGKITGAFLK